jgi:hypothetical protein
MKRDGWKGTTRKGKRVVYTCHERATELADITAQVEGQERFHVHLDVPFPITHQEVEARFAAQLQDD